MKGFLKVVGEVDYERLHSMFFRSGLTNLRDILGLTGDSSMVLRDLIDFRLLIDFKDSFSVILVALGVFRELVCG
jgi:hypothetical protein